MGLAYFVSTMVINNLVDAKVIRMFTHASSLIGPDELHYSNPGMERYTELMLQLKCEYQPSALFPGNVS